jgi:tetratricopeptide (TPR) repeat protein
MALLETEVAARWNVYHTGKTIQAYEGFPLWVAEIERFAKSSNAHAQNMRASSLVSRSYQLQGSIFRDTMDYQKAHTSYKKAFLAADEFDNTELKSSSLARRGVTFLQQHKPIDAIQYLESALLPLDDLDLPYLKGYIF